MLGAVKAKPLRARKERGLDRPSARRRRKAQVGTEKQAERSNRETFRHEMRFFSVCHVGKSLGSIRQLPLLRAMYLIAFRISRKFTARRRPVPADFRQK